MTDWALNDTGDLDLSTKDLVFVSGAEAVRQHLGIRLHFVLGEWFLDLREGIAWFDVMLAKMTTDTRRLEIIREVISETPGVRSVVALRIDVNRATREASILASAKLTTGEVLDFSQSFIVGDA